MLPTSSRPISVSRASPLPRPMSPSAKQPRLPRVFIVRHGETEWSISGQHTGRTDLPLTQHGEDVVRDLGKRIVGDGEILDPAHIKHAFVSPRQRARKTFELLFQSSPKGLPEHSIEEGVREWDYGVCEGKTTATIRGEIGESWDIWTDGCPEGETAQQMSDRCDAMIEKIVDMTSAHHGNEGNADCHGDILIVSHGHFSRCFLTRWCKLPLTDGRIFIADVGALHVCSFQHRNFDERSLAGLNLYGNL
ncbi:hypothetical protein JCM8547_003475 [Rhodosporidiobolus lusitaniae]